MVFAKNKELIKSEQIGRVTWRDHSFPNLHWQELLQLLLAGRLGPDIGIYSIYTHDMKGKIILDRHHSFEPHIRNIRQMFCKTTDCTTVSSERLRHFRKEWCQAEVAQAAVTWLWFHIWTMMMILKMLQKDDLQAYTCSILENSPQMDFRQRPTFLSPPLLPLTDGSFL